MGKLNWGTSVSCLLIPGPQHWVDATRLWSWMSPACQNGSIARFYYGLKLLLLQNRWDELRSALPAGKLTPFVQQMLERGWERLRADSTHKVAEGWVWGSYTYNFPRYIPIQGQFQCGDEHWSLLCIEVGFCWMELYSQCLVEPLTLRLRPNSFKYFLCSFSWVFSTDTGHWTNCLALETQRHLLLGLTM